MPDSAAVRFNGKLGKLSFSTENHVAVQVVLITLLTILLLEIAKTFGFTDKDII